MVKFNFHYLPNPSLNNYLRIKYIYLIIKYDSESNIHNIFILKLFLLKNEPIALSFFSIMLFLA